MKERIRTIATIIYWTVILTLFSWLFNSWVDVVTHNTDPATAKELATHSWNFFVMFFN